MSSDHEPEYLVEDVPSTNASKGSPGRRICHGSLLKLQRLWILFIRCVGRHYIAEFLATFVLMVFGTGSIAQVVLSSGSHGEWLSINLGWGFGIMFGCYVAMGVSGAHMNPAVTLAMSIMGRLPWKRLPGYWIAQYLGAFVSSAVVFGIYYDALVHYEGGSRTITTAGIWATYPQQHVHNITGFFDQVFGTFLLVLGIVAICDARNTEPKFGIKPLMIGLLMVAIGATYGYNCGYAINPARDFSPRLFTFCAGWGVKVFTHHDYWCWIPIVATKIGAILGGFTYIILIELHHVPPTQF